MFNHMINIYPIINNLAKKINEKSANINPLTWKINEKNLTNSTIANM